MTVLKSKFDAVLFDGDGVLFHTTGRYETAVISYFRDKIGFKDFDDVAFQTYIAKTRLKAGMQTVFQTFAITEDLSFHHHTLQIVINETMITAPAVEGATHFVRSLCCPFALVTSAPRATTWLKLETAQVMNEFLGKVVCGDEVINRKPDPEGYLKAAKILKVSPQNCLVIEDSPWGVEAGVSTGATVWGFIGTFSETEHKKRREDLIESGAEEVFTDFDALYDAFYNQ